MLSPGTVESKRFALRIDPGWTGREPNGRRARRLGELAAGAGAELEGGAPEPGGSMAGGCNSPFDLKSRAAP
jgi:hypothetical protein